MDTVFVAQCPACLSKDFVPYIKVSDYRASKEEFELIRCAHCALVVTQRHPAAHEIGRYYDTGEYISHAAGGTSLFDRLYFLVRNRMARRKQKWVERLSAKGRLLDIGAGSGFFLSYMREAGWNVTGIEPSSDARQVAQKMHGISLLEPDMLFSLPDNSFDVITLWHVLEHVHMPEDYLRKIWQILPDNGHLIVALPNYTSMDARYYGQYWAAWDVPRHLWHFAPQAVSAITIRTGFTRVDEHTLPFDAPYVALMSEKYKGGGILKTLRGVTIGILSMVNGLLQKEKGSSVVYVFRKSSMTSPN